MTDVNEFEKDIDKIISKINDLKSAVNELGSHIRVDQTKDALDIAVHYLCVMAHEVDKEWLKND